MRFKSATLDLPSEFHCFPLPITIWIDLVVSQTDQTFVLRFNNNWLSTDTCKQHNILSDKPYHSLARPDLFWPQNQNSTVVHCDSAISFRSNRKEYVLLCIENNRFIACAKCDRSRHFALANWRSFQMSRDSLELFPVQNRKRIFADAEFSPFGQLKVNTIDSNLLTDRRVDL